MCSFGLFWLHVAFQPVLGSVSVLGFFCVFCFSTCNITLYPYMVSLVLNRYVVSHNATCQTCLVLNV
jgi:hypothetical protein